MREYKEIEKDIENTSPEQMEMLAYLINSDLDREQISGILVGVINMVFGSNLETFKAYINKMSQRVQEIEEEVNLYEQKNPPP